MPRALQPSLTKQRNGARQARIHVASGYSLLAETQQVDHAISTQGISGLEKYVVELAAQEFQCFCAEIARSDRVLEPGDRTARGPLCTKVVERRFLAMTLVIWRRTQPSGARSRDRATPEDLLHSVRQIVRDVLSCLVSSAEHLAMKQVDG